MDDDDDKIKVFKYRPSGEFGWQVYSYDQRHTMLEMIAGDLDGIGGPDGDYFDIDPGPAFEVEVAWMLRKEFDSLPEFEGY
jgi:hypothetical protein